MWDTMKHPTSRMLHSYWDRLRRERAAPERSEVEPGAIRNLLADALILELDMPRSAASVRLAGTHVCALFGRELKGRSFDALWGAPDADPWRLIEAVALDTVGVVAGLRGTTERGEAVDLELLLLPLRHQGETQSRILGALSPACVPHWLGLRPVTRRPPCASWGTRRPRSPSTRRRCCATCPSRPTTPFRSGVAISSSIRAVGPDAVRASVPAPPQGGRVWRARCDF
jgi:hypothetical protein